MCGIAGFVLKNCDNSKELIDGMTSALSHRGPDAQGTYLDGDLAFGHRRLSVLDLRDSANQPMHSEDGRYTMVFNGEVYNFQEIATELGSEMQTTGDSEVILKAFQKWGPDCLQRFNGMFSLAIWDREEKSLFIARDRIGIKPLYVYQQDGEIAFASELKSFGACAPIKEKLSIDHEAIYHYLYLSFIPAPYSAYKQIRKFPKGSYGIFKNGELSIQSYWNLEDQIDGKLISDERSAIEQLDEALQKSISYRMISDVPFGAFLSGGTDSSTVCAVAQACSDKNLKTFSIGFKESKFNEAPFAKEVAKAIGTEHTEFMLSEMDALDMFPQILDTYDEPFADSSSIPTMLVSKLARKDVTVVLTGDGGDELFHGYGSYNWAQRIQNPLLRAGRKLIGPAMSLAGERFERAGKLINYSDKNRLKSHIFSQEQYAFTDKELSEMWNGRGEIKLDELVKSSKRDLSPVEEQALFDLRYYMPDDLLVKVDRASMLTALEARVPILDHHVVSLALNIDPSLKIKNGDSKWVLKQVLYRYLPESLFDRPKWGFGMPLVNWLKGPLSGWIDLYLSDEIVEEAGLVNLQFVKALRTSFFEGKTYLYHRLWLLILLHKWYSETSLVK